MTILSDIQSILKAAGILSSSLVVGLVLDKVVLRRLKVLASRTPWEGDEIVVDSLRGLLLYSALLTGLYGVATQVPMTVGLQRLAGNIFLVTIILVATLFFMRLAAGFVTHYAKKAVLPSISIFSNLAKVSVFSIGILIILQSLGISIAPILTALGVGGLAVALALQDTLSNIFAGLHIIATRQIRQGDYIRLASGEEGYVNDITWRNTTVQTLPNNMVIIPNSKLAGAIVTNYNLPDREMAVLVQVGVSYASDLDHVERVTIEVASELLHEVQGGASGFDPFIRYHTFADFSINFTVILRGKEYVDQHLLKHEFVKRLHRRYAREKIEIPFPIRTLHIKQEAPAQEGD
ncbi:mechanosensitive ion channel family protein [Geobacter sulfurreducens]|jgi:small-conductance mechanosensitive channel|uniref:Mechanosensitive ion channel family protein n=1 Tax=Geobacter sulfurreducens (strain ATCC 51573 / DSM 12127 / PCA) TaxID=243231 RepID=Q74AJ7_GEOSL|nr:mechanosensitive ion channel family protein [Geobacter sulfurreducens]AAR35731.1 mechanosensitive ion channel family protein [Geobacter sulfurreducens PCA]ADI85112.1 mechanosensitive ion channel family protein [Geobacter sulfurreducens KN400]UAC03061.1 mechanosensitive ion channel family protein [Geobacter sulfurreducens]UTG91709.1 mechanosensitive ion channel family protein [Geobacter sulfurreducens]HBB68705.1 mechanosensitive ion channel family protein [Geobacter sulfurreducens]